MQSLKQQTLLLVHPSDIGLSLGTFSPIPEQRLL